jgi:phosphoribosylglycinamide formyltransferase-1
MLMADKTRVGVLVSGGGTNLQSIIDASEANRIDAEVVFVGSDNPDAYGIARAEKHGIPSFVVDFRNVLSELRGKPLEKLTPEDFDLESMLSKQGLASEASDLERTRRYMSSRAIAEALLLREMGVYAFDLLVLAGFMRMLTPYFIDHVNTDPSRPRIMNIHPSLLPSFPGVDGYGDTFRYGCKVAGCTVHFVDYGEDTGPIVGQTAFEIYPGDTIDTIKEKGIRLEWELYIHCIQLFAENRLRVVNKTYILENGTTLDRKIVIIDE